MSSIDSSPEGIRQLIRDVYNGLKAMKRCNEELLSDLRSLERTFKDDDVNVVRNNVRSAEKKLNDVTPKIQAVCEKLAEYANHLEMSEKQISGGIKYGSREHLSIISESFQNDATECEKNYNHAKYDLKKIGSLGF